LERFTYTVSHDLKAPLVTINGFIGYLIDDTATGNMDRLKYDIQRISGAVDRMNNLLKDLLELSRIGRLINPAESISSEELFHEVMEQVEGSLKERNIQVQVAQDLPVLHGDRQRLMEVFQNLIENAAKYMGDQSSPCIEIGHQGEEEGKPIFYIRDNGIGIAPEFHERIFGLFNKLDAQSDGTGIGLALVKRIIEVHGGRIWVESQLGSGATFYFTLPCA
jgi:signal transduction histidine kinase